MFAIRMLALSAFVLLSSLFAVAYVAEIPDEQKWHVGETATLRHSEVYCMTEEQGRKYVKLLASVLPAKVVTFRELAIIQQTLVQYLEGCVMVPPNFQVKFEGVVEGEKFTTARGDVLLVGKWSNPGGEAYAVITEDYVSDKSMAGANDESI